MTVVYCCVEGSQCTALNCQSPLVCCLTDCNTVALLMVDYTPSLLADLVFQASCSSRLLNDGVLPLGYALKSLFKTFNTAGISVEIYYYYISLIF